ncbi:hypothetical protein CR152_09185 [Massilia violaceinigra]|uniref:Uncharacterized protein n=2 Tax=Massilia violaceinigra TaxID=2045208 RepID=A0A2D2DI72_9BURK|nr:hypothetical protein CR152_09185 [Massilia violaceinigra]
MARRFESDMDAATCQDGRSLNSITFRCPTVRHPEEIGKLMPGERFAVGAVEHDTNGGKARQARHTLPETGMADQMTTPTKDEINAKLDASEARVDARLANFDVSVKTGFAELRTAFAELRADMEKMRADIEKM